MVGSIKRQNSTDEADAGNLDFENGYADMLRFVDCGGWLFQLKV